MIATALAVPNKRKKIQKNKYVPLPIAGTYVEFGHLFARIYAVVARLSHFCLQELGQIC